MAVITQILCVICICNIVARTRFMPPRSCACAKKRCFCPDFCVFGLYRYILLVCMFNENEGFLVNNVGNWCLNRVLNVERWICLSNGGIGVLCLAWFLFFLRPLASPFLTGTTFFAGRWLM